MAAYVTDRGRRPRRGARGVEALLKARGEWPELLERYFAEPGGRVPFDPATLVALGRRVVGSRARRCRRPRSGSTTGSPGRCACWPMRRPGDRLRRRQVRADRAEDRGDAHVDRHGRHATSTRSTRCTATSAWSDRSDVAIVLSKSGESEELFGAGGVACSGWACRSSPSPAPWTRRSRGWRRGARWRRWRRRPVPHDLAPTTSTTVALALGDALAVALLRGEGVPPRGLRGASPGRLAGPEAAAPGARRDGASGPRARPRRDDAGGGGEPGPRPRPRDGGGRRPLDGRAHHRRPHAPGRAGPGVPRPAR